jgi:hypothetical protein
MIRIVSTSPFSPPLPQVKALPVVFPLRLTTDAGPVAPFGIGKAVPPGETIKSGPLAEALPPILVTPPNRPKNPVRYLNPEPSKSP